MTRIKCDVSIVGAGPVGLALGINLALGGMSVTIIEQSSAAALNAPAFDGREIALTPYSIEVLKRLGVWSRFNADDISELRSAQVMDGLGVDHLELTPVHSVYNGLAKIVSNYRIRAELARVALALPLLRLVCDCQIREVRVGEESAQIDGAFGGVDSRLLVAADSRFSKTRQAIGIGTKLRDLGRSILTFRISQTHNHRNVATEWFAHHRTMAFLPLKEGLSSAVITVPSSEIAKLLDAPDASLASQLEHWTNGRFGRVEIVGTRHVYPLTTTYADTFVRPRAALVGDAAVGMHPVTAHGFNFGLRGQETLAKAVLRAHSRKQDIGSLAILSQYDVKHRAETLPLYMATNALTSLYTKEDMIGRLARRLSLKAAKHLPLMPRLIASALMH